MSETTTLDVTTHVFGMGTERKTPPYTPAPLGHLATGRPKWFEGIGATLQAGIPRVIPAHACRTGGAL